MTGDGLRETAPPPGRRRGALARLRYVPLILLVLAVIVATVLGVVETRSADDEKTSARTSGTAPAGPSLPAVCAPAVDQQIDVEHWRDDQLEPAAETAFARGIARSAPGHVRGRDGWLFFTDAQAKDFSQAVGRERQGPSSIARWNDYLGDMRRAAQARGGRFYVMIAPAKWDVRHDRLPTWAQRLRGTTSLDRLMQVYPELPFVDVRAALRDASEPTYSPLNSHWTDFGGYVAWQAATACLRADGVDGVDVPPITGVDVTDDRNEFAADGVSDPDEPAWTQPRLAAAHPDTTITSIATGATLQPLPGDVVDMTQLPVRTSTSGAQSSETLLVLRDSTGSALSPLWSTSFARTVQYQHPVGEMGAPVDLAAIVDRERPDVTIFTMTERYLSFDPPTS
ncbi:hypothetical protein [Aeromicrobium sp. Root472D3]|uniref:alginate O-acetyltransferase AlgX-related protein n=1 Tax=Aeromicrobium sp. Root472D3 TaxID=1736540 RepID=UPI0006F6D683|nr:hypothetical protein [Aeromicrobium sp. Root472D3]KQX71786.1 hypothetical protein ASD10_17635 [Aeromicrobium sp. Root472D3]